MANYTDIEKQNLLQTPVIEILAHYGKDIRQSGRNMYFSPFRDERTASFSVKPGGFLWFDFGIGEGGGALDLVCRLSGCRRNEAMDILATINGKYPNLEQEVRRRRAEPKRTASAVIITKVRQTFTNTRLISYAESRGISKEILDRNCQQVDYRLASRPNVIITAIGFMNDNGGYSLRSSRTKISSSSFISTIKGPEDARGRIFVFEGFFDYLSYLAIRKTVSLRESALVLNGVGNVSHALKVLEGYREVNLLLDNDDAGRKCRDIIWDHLTGEGLSINVCDLSALYGRHKDLNSLLCTNPDMELPSNDTEYGHTTNEGGPGTPGQDQLG